MTVRVHVRLWNTAATAGLYAAQTSLKSFDAQGRTDVSATIIHVYVLQLLLVGGAESSEVGVRGGVTAVSSTSMISDLENPGVGIIHCCSGPF